MSQLATVRSSYNPYRKPTLSAELAWAPEPDVRDFHRQLPGYRPTPLVSLPALASELGVASIHVKDESQRFGLNAFKVLGASYAMYRFMRRRWDELGLGLSGSALSPAQFLDPQVTSRLGTLTFATATDGNHGRAVAWTARRLGQKAVIYVPGNTVPARIENIRGEGASVVVVEGTYDETVQRAAADAARDGWQVISDTAYPGYMEIPRWIMEGYRTVFEEVEEQQSSAPTVVLLQAGVGGLACAGTLHYLRKSGAQRPHLLSVEPTDADCLLESILAKNGELSLAKGRQGSIMAGLNCGTPSLLAWPVIRGAMDYFLAVDDDYARDAMRRLAHPNAGETPVVSGESGAAGLAGLLALAKDPSLAKARQEFFGPEARVLLVSTEGDTDPVSYNAIVGKK